MRPLTSTGSWADASLTTESGEFRAYTTLLFFDLAENRHAKPPPLSQNGDCNLGVTEGGNYTRTALLYVSTYLAL